MVCWVSCLGRNNRITIALVGSFLPAHKQNTVMAVNEILFKELPFRPDHNQVFYIENGYDSDANNFIRSNYFELKSMFADIGMDFYYLPYLLREHDIEAKVRYYAPYLSPKLLVTEVRSDAFVPYISDDDTRKNLKPSFVFEGMQSGYGGDTRFLQVLLSDIDITQSKSLEDLMRLVLERREAYYQEIMRRHAERFEAESACYSRMDIEETRSCEMEMACPSAAPSASDEWFGFEEERTVRDKPKASSNKPGMWGRILRHFNLNEDKSIEVSDNDAFTEKTEEELAEEKSLIETANVLRELRMTVQKLRLEGVSLMAIHEFIDKQEPLSRMIITPDYRIFLPDYNDMEIEMGALPKAIYFLYLRYPEGIIYKHMQDYYNELLNIYRQLRPNTDEARLNLTITKVVNPMGNALNENIARIRKAFVEKFDEHLANNYIITGERGSQYLIPLDRDLITWEE